MRFGRRRSPFERRGSAEHLVGRARDRLAAFTLLLVIALVSIAGLITAAAAVRAMEASVDRTLTQSAAAVMSGLAQDAEAASSAPGASNETEESGDEGAVQGALPPTSPPTASPSPLPLETDEHVPSSADTFFLILDGSGSLVTNPQNVALRGLPDVAAVAAARQRGEDIRTATVAGTAVRLLTQPIAGEDGVVRGYLQSAIVLSLLQSQEADLWQTVLLVTLVGVLGATGVTLLVTHRALTPIRRAFATERRFVAAASHELRTPIAVMRASAEILEREHLVEPAGERFVHDLIAESDRLARQVADLLALSSIDAGAVTIRPRPVELQPFLHDLAGRAQTMASAHGVTIEVEPGNVSSIVAETDPERLEQLLMIFIDNAVDHSPANGVVRLVLDSRSASRDTATISVVDQGPGIPPRERTRIFEPFAKLPRRRRTGASTGLGLAIARTLADRLHAAIEIGDAPGGGAVFSVTLRMVHPGRAPGWARRVARR